MISHRAPPVASSSLVRPFDRIGLPHSSSQTKNMRLLTDSETTTMASADFSVCDACDIAATDAWTLTTCACWAHTRQDMTSSALHSMHTL